VQSAASQALRYPLHKQQIGRAGEQKATWGAFGIHRPLDGEQQVWRPLYFVNDQAGTAEQGVRLACSPVESLNVVQADIDHARAYLLRQGALAGLAGAGDHDHGRGFHRLAHQIGRRARQAVMCIHAVNDYHS